MWPARLVLGFGHMTISTSWSTVVSNVLKRQQRPQAFDRKTGELAPANLGVHGSIRFRPGYNSDVQKFNSGNKRTDEVRER
jgi:hypothetical protein